MERCDTDPRSLSAVCPGGRGNSPLHACGRGFHSAHASLYLCRVLPACCCLTARIKKEAAYFAALLPHSRPLPRSLVRLFGLKSQAGPSLPTGLVLHSK